MQSENGIENEMLKMKLSHCDIILLLIRIQFTQIILCIYAPLWCQNHFKSLSLWRQPLPPYFFDLDRPYYLNMSSWCE